MLNRVRMKIDRGDGVYKIAVCDDDPHYRRFVVNMLQENKFDDEVLIYEYSSGEELMKEIHKMHDLLFLDIQMNGLDGNETAKEFRKVNKDAVLIFCTNYQNPTMESFKVKPYRYIMKDLHNLVLKEEMPYIIKEMVEHKKEYYLNITQDGKIFRIPIKDIIYISVVKRGAILHLWEKGNKKEIFCRENLKNIYQQLSNVGFVYAHNSYIVNMANIIKVNKNVITLIDKTELNISRSKQKNFDITYSRYINLRYKRKY